MLKQALGFLEGFYKAKASFAQRDEPVGPPPPKGFTAYKKNAASAGVMSLLEQIITDAKAMEDETLQDEASAEQAYQSFVKETNDSIEAKVSAMNDKKATKADKESDRAEAHA